MSVYGGPMYQPGVVPIGGVPMGGVVGGVPMGPAYGTPYVEPMGNSLMMSGVGTPYATPLIDGYQPSLSRQGSLRGMSSVYSPSLYDGRRTIYDGDIYDYDRRYDRDYDYDRGRRYYDDDDLYRYGSRSRSSRRYDDYDYGYGYDRRYYDDDYYRSGSRYYPSSYRSSSRSRSGRSMSIITNDKGNVKVLRNGQERIGDKVRRIIGMDPKGVNIVRLKRGESLAANVRR